MNVYIWQKPTYENLREANLISENWKGPHCFKVCSLCGKLKWTASYGYEGRETEIIYDYTSNDLNTNNFVCNNCEESFNRSPEVMNSINAIILNNLYKLEEKIMKKIKGKE